MLGDVTAQLGSSFQSLIWDGSNEHQLWTVVEGSIDCGP